MDHRPASLGTVPDQRGRRVWVVDPCLMDGAGHYRNIDVNIAEEAAGLGLDPHILASKRLDPRLDLPCPTQPVFTCSGNDSVADDPEAAELEDFVRLNASFRAELGAALAGRLAPGDVVVFPNMRQTQLIGLGRWLDGLARPRPAVLVVLLAKPDFVPAHLVGTHAGRTEIADDAYAIGFHALRRAHPEGVRYLVDMPSLARRFGHLGAAPVEVINFLGYRGQFCDVAPPTDRGRVRVAYAGNARTDKGFHLLPEIVATVLGRAPEAEFAIQACVDMPLPPLVAAAGALERQAAVDARIRLHRGVFDRAEYFAFLRDADVVLLPYEPADYRDRSSGILQEAVALGKPIVVPAGLDAAAGPEAEGTAVTFEGFSAAAVSAAVTDAVHAYPALSRAAYEARDRLARPGIGAVLGATVAAGAPVAPRRLVPA